MSTMHMIPSQGQSLASPSASQPTPGKIKILYTGKRRQLYGEGMRFLTFRERVLSSWLCGHDWSFPVTLKEHTYNVKVAASGNKPAYDFDSHQTCLRCGDHRLFSTKIWAPGPMFRRSVTRQPGVRETA